MHSIKIIGTRVITDLLIVMFAFMLVESWPSLATLVNLTQESAGFNVVYIAWFLVALGIFIFVVEYNANVLISKYYDDFKKSESEAKGEEL